MKIIPFLSPKNVSIPAVKYLNVMIDACSSNCTFVVANISEYSTAAVQGVFRFICSADEMNTFEGMELFACRHLNKLM